jgi:hypothetical protein
MLNMCQVKEKAKEDDYELNNLDNISTSSFAESATLAVKPLQNQSSQALSKAKRFSPLSFWLNTHRKFVKEACAL